jgi:hypothetical protein
VVAIVDTGAIEPGFAVACGDGRFDRIIDALDTVGSWTVCCSEPSQATVSL